MLGLRFDDVIGPKMETWPIKRKPNFVLVDQANVRVRRLAGDGEEICNDLGISGEQDFGDSKPEVW